MTTQRDTDLVQLDLAVRDHAAVPVLGHVLPDRPAAGADPVDRVAAAAVARRRRWRGRCRSGSSWENPRLNLAHLVILLALAAAGIVAMFVMYRRQLERRMSGFVAVPRVLPIGLGSRRAMLLIERNVYVYRRGWMVIFSGFFEPLFYLLAIGLGIGGMVGEVPGPTGRRSRTRCSWRRRCSPRRR